MPARLRSERRSSTRIGASSTQQAARLLRKRDALRADKRRRARVLGRLEERRERDDLLKREQAIQLERDRLDTRARELERARAAPGRAARRARAARGGAGGAEAGAAQAEEAAKVAAAKPPSRQLRLGATRGGRR